MSSTPPAATASSPTASSNAAYGSTTTPPTATASDPTAQSNAAYGSTTTPSAAAASGLTATSDVLRGISATPKADESIALGFGLLYPFVDENDGLLKMFVDVKGNGIDQIFSVARIGSGKGVGGYGLEATPSQTNPPVTTYVSRYSFTDQQTLISKWQNYATDWATHTLPPDCIEGCFEYLLRDNKNLLDETVLSNWAVWLRVNSHLSSPPPVTTPPPESESPQTDSTLPASTGSESLPTIGNFGPNGLPTIPVVSGTPDSPTVADPSNSNPAGPDPAKGTLHPVFDDNALKMYVKFNGGGNNLELTVDKIGVGGGTGGYILNSRQTNVSLDSSWLPVSTFKINDLQTLISKWQAYPGDWSTHTLPPSCSEGCFEYFLRDNIPLLDETVMNDYSKFLFTKGRLTDPNTPAMATSSPTPGPAGSAATADAGSTAERPFVYSGRRIDPSYGQPFIFSGRRIIPSYGQPFIYSGLSINPSYGQPFIYSGLSINPSYGQSFVFSGRRIIPSYGQPFVFSGLRININ
ncbi:hypothetical protein PV04_03331 [Phialophora macrospora]|uniref:Uncharacterized protein n=1 Tax=Phialophora macrospora TaxID=1851006 RepID=A0A0D2E9Z1_9EURO|nr:hypothetical protein PV04_03331 [Phialophora macrospora]